MKSPLLFSVLVFSFGLQQQAIARNQPYVSQTNAQQITQRVNVFEDRDSLSELLGTAVACRLSEELLVDLPRAPLFFSESGVCEPALDSQAEDSASVLFSDGECLNPVSVSPIPLQTFCQLALDKEFLGDGSGLSQTPGHPQWTLSPGTEFDLGAATLRGLSQPYVQRVNYKQITNMEGTCNLEMRIYKNSISESGLLPMVALHGGSWRARGFGFFGLEMTVPQFTNQGYVVFAPFYRLIDTKESSAACNGASIGEVREDAADALRWVIENAHKYGASDYPTVFGQSAGAHLATSLAADFPDQVANAVLFYPPTDFTDFAVRVQDGRYTNEEGLGILEAVIGTDEIELISLADTPIPENSFPLQVMASPSSFPPMFMMHGLADELVEATQSTRLCGALQGDVDSVGDRDFWIEQSGLRDVVECDERGSELHLLREGDHALDVCVSGNLLLQDLCLSGSTASRALVADSVVAATSWASSIALQRAEERETLLAGSDGSSGRSGGSGTVSIAWLFSILGLLVLRISRRQRFHTLWNF